MVWSDVLLCQYCSKEVLFWGNGVNIKTGKMPKTFKCPHCGSEINCLTCEKSRESYYDYVLSEVKERIKRVPVLINYRDGKKSYEKIPDNYDMEVIKKYEQELSSIFIKPEAFIKGDMYRSGYHYGMTHVHHFLTQGFC